LDAQSIAALAIGVVVAVIVLAVAVPISRRLALRRISKVCTSWAAPGAVKTGFGQHRMAVGHALAESQMDYSLFTKVAIHDEVVVMKHARQRAYTLLPREIVPDTAVALIKNRIAEGR
jgi:hypothetical protein